MGILIQVIIKGRVLRRRGVRKNQGQGKSSSRDMVLRWRQLQPDPAGNSGTYITPWSWCHIGERGHWLSVLQCPGQLLAVGCPGVDSGVTSGQGGPHLGHSLERIQHEPKQHHPTGDGNVCPNLVKSFWARHQ